MTTQDPALLAIPSIPLCSGSYFIDADGTRRTIATVSVHVVADSGISMSVPMTFEHNGWWAPRD